MNFGYKTSFKSIDKGNIEIIGPFGLSFLILAYSEIITYIHSGLIFHYAFLIMFSILCILFSYTFITGCYKLYYFNGINIFLRYLYNKNVIKIKY